MDIELEVSVMQLSDGIYESSMIYKSLIDAHVNAVILYHDGIKYVTAAVRHDNVSISLYYIQAGHFRHVDKRSV